MRSSKVFIPLFLIGLAVACGSSSGSNFTDNGQSDAGPDGSASGNVGPLISADSGPTSSSGGDGTCASKILCGDQSATCCAVGQECVNNACAAACESGVRCGATCCQSGQVCLSQACVAPGKACNDSFDCDENEFCEPTIGKCLPQPADGPGACLYKPPVAPLALKLEWSWTGSNTILPEYNQVVNTPSVVDLDGDKFPDVVIVTSKNNGDAYDADKPAYIRALDGRDGTEKWAATVDAFNVLYAVNPRGTTAVADVDGDGKIEIYAPAAGGGVVAFHGDGSFYWKSTTTLQPGSVTIAIADMDNDGIAEVVEGGLVFNAQTGALAFPPTYTLASDQHLWGANDPTYGPVSIIADVDGIDSSNDQMVVTGNRAFKKSGFLVWDKSATLTDGYTAIADLDKDGKPELVVIAQGNIRVQNAVTGELIDSIALPGSGRGGPPTISDFDNDGVPEMASANGTKYNVFEYDPTKVSPDHKISVKWSQDTQDGSSNVTGSSVFDFEGDGSSEVIYNDECYSRVYRGNDGSELYKIVNSSATIHEMPVLVDVDGDNHTELLVVANDVNHLNGSVKCPNYVAANGDVPRHGVFSYGDANNKWVRTRKIWNQHAYHVTNVLADGKTPMVEPRSFTVAQNNDYRVSEQGKGVYNAPDLQVDLTVSLDPCPTSIELRARVSNQGSLGVPAGVSVTFYAGTDATGQQLGNGVTTKALLPGESEVVLFEYTPTGTPSTAFFVSVDGTAVTGVINECLTDNNTGKAGGVRCPVVN